MRTGHEQLSSATLKRVIKCYSSRPERTNCHPIMNLTHTKSFTKKILEDANDNSKMRNIAHMKKFVEPETAEKGGLVQPKEQPQVPKQMKQIHPTTTASQQAAEVQESPPNPLPGNSVVSRPARSRRSPAWMQDYVCT